MRSVSSTCAFARDIAEKDFVAVKRHLTAVSFDDFHIGSSWPGRISIQHGRIIAGVRHNINMLLKIFLEVQDIECDVMPKGRGFEIKYEIKNGMEHTGLEPVTSTLPVWRAPQLR